MPSRSRTVETNWRGSSGFSKKASAPDWSAWSRESIADTATTGIDARSCASRQSSCPAPPEMRRSITTRLGGSSSRIFRAVVGVEGDSGRVALGAQEVLGELCRERVALGEQDRDQLVGAGSRLDREAVSFFQQSMSIGRLHPTVELFEDEAQLIDLVSAVEALPAGASCGNDLVVALFPAAKRLCRDAEHLDDGADAVDAVLFRGLHSATHHMRTVK